MSMAKHKNKKNGLNIKYKQINSFITSSSNNCLCYLVGPITCQRVEDGSWLNIT